MNDLCELTTGVVSSSESTETGRDLWNSLGLTISAGT